MNWYYKTMTCLWIFNIFMFLYCVYKVGYIMGQLDSIVQTLEG